MSSFSDANELLESGGITPAKFEEPGTTLGGKVIYAEVQQPGNRHRQAEVLGRRQATGSRSSSTCKPRRVTRRSPTTTASVPCTSAATCSRRSAPRSAPRVPSSPREAPSPSPTPATASAPRPGSTRPSCTRSPTRGSRFRHGRGQRGARAQPAAPAAPPAPVRPPSVPAAVWDTLTAEQQAALLAVTPAFLTP